MILNYIIKVILRNLLFNDENLNEEKRILNLLDINLEITMKKAKEHL